MKWFLRLGEEKLVAKEFSTSSTSTLGKGCGPTGCGNREKRDGEEELDSSLSVSGRSSLSDTPAVIKSLSRSSSLRSMLRNE